MVFYALTAEACKSQLSSIVHCCTKIKRFFFNHEVEYVANFHSWVTVNIHIIVLFLKMETKATTEMSTKDVSTSRRAYLITTLPFGRPENVIIYYSLYYYMYIYVHYITYINFANYNTVHFKSIHNFRSFTFLHTITTYFCRQNWKYSSI